MLKDPDSIQFLQNKLELPCGVILKNRLADAWLTEQGGDPEFPEFEFSPPGGVTAWYTMRLTALGEDRENMFELNLPSAVRSIKLLANSI